MVQRELRSPTAGSGNSAEKAGLGVARVVFLGRKVGFRT